CAESAAAPARSVFRERLELRLELLDPGTEPLDLVLELLPRQKVRHDGLHALVDLVLPVFERPFRAVDQARLSGGGRARSRARLGRVLDRHRLADRVRAFLVAGLALAARDEPADGPLSKIAEHLLGALVDELLQRLERDV